MKSKTLLVLYHLKASLQIPESYAVISYGDRYAKINKETYAH